MSSLREGDRISNYLLEARVGAGSFGEVWRARHHVFDEIVAIKVPTDAQYVRNLQREGVAIHGIRHPNIVRALDLDPYGDPPYLIMEYVDGPSLRDAVDHYKSTFPMDAAVTIMRGVLRALAASHASGLIHRDIKPANILLNQPLEHMGDVEERMVKVTDFGLGDAGGMTTQAMMQSGSLETEAGRSVAGTLAYMAPELKEGRAADARIDLYSCGIVLFELLTGERPQGSDSPSSLRSEVPDNLDHVFQRCYTRPDRRFASAEEMLAALEPSGSATERSASGGGVADAVPCAAVGGSIKCLACGASCAKEDQFCITCGRQLVAAIPRCPKCDAYVSVKDRYCIHCGNDLRVLTG